MKKTVVTMLVLVLVLGIGSTALAAVNPFTDVPANHWAYAAVKELAKEGIIDGFNGPFQGDKPLTRYEMAQIVAKAMAKEDKADARTKLLLDKLAAEFAIELNNLGVRVNKLEEKTNVWFGGDTRIRVLGDSPNSGNKLSANNQFDFRTRVKFMANLNDNMSFSGRFATGTIKPEGSSSTTIDLANVTLKNAGGIDSIVVGRMPVMGLGNGMIGRPSSSDGLYVADQMGKYSFKGYVANINANADSTNTTNSNTLGLVNIGTKLSKTLNINTGYYWADIQGGKVLASSAQTTNTKDGAFTRSKGWSAAFDTKVGGLTLMGEYIGTRLENASGLPSNPTGWAVQLDTGSHAPLFYPTVNLVNPAKVGEDAWMIGYRSVGAGAVPFNAGNWDTTAVNNSILANSGSAATDNVKALYVAYQNVIAKNTLLSLEYQDLKYKDKSLTSKTSDGIDKTYMLKFEFFY